MIDLRPKVLEHVKMNGPVLPVNVSKAINTSILFASAVMSELVSEGELFMSKAKIGGSSVYYVKSQEGKLQMLRNYLGDVPKKAYDILKEKTVLCDKKIEPYQRVALRELKDFAVPLNVKYNGADILFWKWYLAGDDVATEIIKKDLDIKEESVENTEKIKSEAIPENTIEKDSAILQSNNSADKIADVKTDEKPQEQTTLNAAETKHKQRVDRHKQPGNDMIFAYFKKNGITINSSEFIKKNKDAVYFVNLQSQIGVLPYMVYFKDKKKISEEDVILAYHKGQEHKMPVLFLSNGELAKQAQDHMDKNLKGMILFKKI